jgi:hypothetical protein
MLLPRGRIAVVVFAMVALLGIPRAASADLIDWILDLSGPPMVGVVLIHCEVAPPERPSRCYVPWTLAPVAQWAITFEPAFYVSDGQGNGPNSYKLGQFRMVSLDPMLEWKKTSHSNRFVFHQGIGGSFDFFWGDKISGFHRSAVKFKPIGLSYAGRVRLDVGVNLRIYPTAFLGNEFGGKPSGKSEHVVKSISFIIWF